MTTITIEREVLDEIVELFDRAITARFPHEILRDLRAALAAPATAPEKTVKEIMGFVRHYAANTFSSATLEDKIRRSLATPATAPAQPVWHDAPTVPGLWMGWHNHVHQIEAGDLRKFSLNSGLRWYGPIPEDRQ